MNKLTLPAPAKLNLFLHILGRRKDGYHNLQTVFQFLDYADEIKLEALTTAQISLENHIENVPAKDNIILKTAALLQQRTGCSLGAKIRVNKRLPVGAGLGGGSSNAATTLIGLNQLWRTQLSLQQLAQLGLQLGADVPVFIHGHAAFAEGIGEKLTALDLPQAWYLVLVPACKIATAAIFSHPQLVRNTPPLTIDDYLHKGGGNDCEVLVRKIYPQVDRAFSWLNQFASAQLTGTGSCIFASFAEKQSAENIAKQIPRGLVGFVARGLNFSPLHHSMKRYNSLHVCV